MNAVIIEDEFLAARRLEDLIRQYDPSLRILTILESVAGSVEWFRNNPPPDLVFMDIHLEDGLSFQIFDQVSLDVPLIFTTAYDEYAIRAFKLKSIDYLQKPITLEELSRAVEKYRSWNGGRMTVLDIDELQRLLNTGAASYRERFSVVVGEKIKSVQVRDIAYFFSTSSITFAVMRSKHQYSLEMSLDRLAGELDPNQFFRINRQFLIGLDSIVNIHVFPKSRLKIELAPPPVEDGIFVSLDRVVDFKRWVDGSAGK
ncbi:MAG: DNA-binding response regulator [Bacteroidetes bacterium]|nr:MAG: DNA-binding response regulator [Bacteroidota bacterium]